MTDPIDNIPDNDAIRESAVKQTDEFARAEGRRPRMLIGRGINTNSMLVHKISNSFADMGFDVDIAPKFNRLKELARQSIENDVDIILICSDNRIYEDELLEFENQILANQTDILISLLEGATKSFSAANKPIKGWIIFDAESNEFLMGQHLMTHLLKSS